MRIAAQRAIGALGRPTERSASMNGAVPTCWGSLGALLRPRRANRYQLVDTSAYLAPSCRRRNSIVRGHASRAAARFACSSAGSRCAFGSSCARRKPWTAPS